MEYIWRPKFVTGVSIPSNMKMSFLFLTCFEYAWAIMESVTSLLIFLVLL